jgi:hypothetical protein
MYPYGQFEAGQTLCGAVKVFVDAAQIKLGTVKRQVVFIKM